MSEPTIARSLNSRADALSNGGSEGDPSLPGKPPSEPLGRPPGGAVPTAAPAPASD